MSVLNCMIDWLEFSILDSAFDFLKVVNLLDLNEFNFEHSRSFYYSDMYNYNNMIYIYENPKGCTKDNKHVHIKLSGKGCRLLEQKYNNCIRDELQGRLMFLNIKVSRMDICIDTNEKFVNDLLLDVSEYRFTCYKSRRIIIDSSTTIYLGSKSSEKFIRIYEKDKESGNADLKDRVEVVLKNEYATNEFYNENSLYKIISSYMAQVEFESPDLQKVWKSLQGEVCKISMGIRHVKTELKEKLEYIITTYGRTIKAGVKAFGAKNVLSAISNELISEKLNKMIKLEEDLRILKARKRHYAKLNKLYDKLYFRNKFVQVSII